MSKSLETRIRQMERELSLMRRELRAGNQRTATPLMPRLGRHFVELYGDLAAGSTAIAMVLIWSGGTLVDSGATLEIRDFQLPDGGMLAAGTRVWAVWDKTCWAWLRASSDHYNLRFQIESADPVTRSVLGSILAWTPTTISLADLPGQETIAGQVTICDPHGCIFNEPAGELIGRTGTATYRQPAQGQAAPCQDDYYPPVPQWEADTLCCPIPPCDQV